MNCANCGAAIPAGTTQCRKCGSTVEAPAQQAQPSSPQGPVNVVIQVPTAEQPVAQATGNPKSKIVAGILGIFLGWLGIHRFYLGYTGIGLIQLLLTVFTCGYGSLITGPWGLIEGILILVGKIDRDGHGRPLEG